VTLPRPVALRGGGLLVVAGVLAWAVLSPSAWKALTVLLVLIGCGCALVLVAHRGPALTLSLGLALTMFSGDWNYMGIPLPLDRLVVAIGLGAVLVDPDSRAAVFARMRQPICILLAVIAVYAALSGYRAGTLQTPDGIYALIDSLGIFPFAFYAFAPIVFAKKRDRDVLLITLVICGGYLGLVALFETIHLESLIFPKFINNPSLGIHYGRARGPFLEASANGLALFACAVASAIAVKQWRGRPKAMLAGLVILLCAGGVIFTLTRAVWISSVVATLITILAFKPTRRFFVPSLVGVVVVALAALFLIPGFSGKAHERSDEQGPIWDRLNTDAAALRMVETRPLFGFGWHTFETEGPNYLRQAAGYPLTGAGLNVHNVFLAHLAELGLVGTILWLIALLWVIYDGAIRAGPPWMLDWRMGFVAIAISWLIVANFVPLTYALPNGLLWLWAGMAGLRQAEEI
jgi:putative inorganic carbon (hco3(-)) transporter